MVTAEQLINLSLGEARGPYSSDSYIPKPHEWERFIRRTRGRSTHYNAPKTGDYWVSWEEDAKGDAIAFMKGGIPGDWIGEPRLEQTRSGRWIVWFTPGG